MKVIKQGRVVPDVGSGLRGPKTVDVEARHPGLDGVKINARIAPVGGVYEVTGLHLQTAGDRPLPPEALRMIPLRTIVRVAVGPILREENRNILMKVTADPATRSPETTKLGSAAHIYRLARVVGDPPTKAIQDAVGCSRATASRIVAAAREAGFLRDDEVGRAGGARSPLGS